MSYREASGDVVLAIIRQALKITRQLFVVDSSRRVVLRILRQKKHALTRFEIEILNFALNSSGGVVEWQVR